MQKTKHALVRPPSSWDWLILNDFNVAKEFDSFVCLSINDYLYIYILCLSIYVYPCLSMFIHVYPCLSMFIYVNLSSISMLWAPAQPHDGFEEGVRSSAGLQPWHAMAITAITAIAMAIRTSSSPSMAVPRSWDASFARTEL